MIAHLQGDYSINFLCTLLGLARSSYYYAPQPAADEALMVDAIEQILLRWPFYGYRRVLAQLQRQGWSVGESRVRRLLRQLNHSCSVGRVRVQTTDSLSRTEENFTTVPDTWAWCCWPPSPKRWP